MKHFLSIVLIALSLSIEAHRLPKVVSGSIKRLSNFNSKYVSPRNIDIWIPDDYTPEKKYSVLYMQDGQMLFDNSSSWHQQSWNVDNIASKLQQAGRVQDFIIVGVWNDAKNHYADYFPQKPFQSLTAEQKDFVRKQLHEKGKCAESFQPNSDHYLKFLVTELKPYIDKHYAVSTDADHTFIAGSSMGGLVAMYAITQYPKVFGGAACLSTHWPGVFCLDKNPVPNAIVHYLKETLPNPDNHKIYFDHGDKTLDALYPALQAQVDACMKSKGYHAGNWRTEYFKGKDHSEKSWRERFYVPLLFLLKKQNT
ncbi:alpha/beta hydrolase [Arcicella rigui]|uniref:Alpha/beta hydrolase-fold protein n=1 Tax=Arcicella rigui TaxID=797020 RepID=A0ABU5QDX3_9BACT|nr:alpha/beta hydrolase-fold protein [Arcicella rigui]MEA5141049.1 alpha/beta hydrolase-fold protein [Arcicella rigui]